MTPDDMAALHGLCFTTPAPWSAAAFATFMQDPLCFTLLEANAFLIGRAVAGEAELLTLAVAPQNRRRGLGARLLSRFVYQARLRGAHQAFLEVAATNAPAIALYTTAGFAITGRRTGYYRMPGATPVDAVLMARALNDPPSRNS